MEVKIVDGKITIPKTILRKLGLLPGDKVVLEVVEKSLIIRSVGDLENESEFMKALNEVKGIWKFRKDIKTRLIG